MLLITADEVHEVCSYLELVDSLEEFHRNAPADLKDMLLSSFEEDPKSDNHFLVRAAWSGGTALGLKAATIFPDNVEDYGRPAIHAIYALYDGRSGVPVAVIDGTAMTYYKTAADSALGSKYLANPNVSFMAMIGAGAMAPHLIKAHCEIHPSIRQVTIWNRTFERAEKLAESLNLNHIEINSSRDIEAAVRNADLVSSATMTTEPIISGEWVSTGTHLDLVGAYRLDMREVDDEAITKSRIFVDSRKTTVGEIGEIEIPLRNGIIRESSVLADLYELCSKKAEGRISEQDVTLFKNGGGGHLDLMTAQYIHSKVCSVTD